MVRGRSLELFFIDGNPEGMLTAEVFNWTGHVLVIPRTRLFDGLSRKEAGFTGTYVLTGELDGLPLAYIGEAEDIASRIRSHDAKKDWWSTAVLITSSANNLHKAHVKYLESRLVEDARAIGKVTLEYVNTPPRSSLSEAAKSNMEAFLETLYLVLPALRIDMFLSKARPEQSVEPERPSLLVTRFEIKGVRINVDAKAELRDGEFIVLAGSTARKEWSGVEYATYKGLYDELRNSGVLTLERDYCVFTQNYAFASPSAAAAVVLGRSANGTKEWTVTETGQTYKAWEAALLSMAEGQVDV